MRQPILFFFLLFLFFSPQISLGETFSRTLFVGLSGEDVRALQVILNKNPRTLISVTGPGSAGQETGYFGLKTKDAVMRFQDLYKNEILLPVGLASPTGIVGLKTQTKLLSLSETSNSAQVLQESVPIEMPTESSPEALTEFLASFFRLPPKLFSVSPMATKPGGEVVVRGQGFLQANNTIHFGDKYSVANVSSQDGLTIQVSIPENIPEGSYNVWVSNKSGSTYDVSYGSFFSVSRNPLPLPEIISSTEDMVIKYGTSSVDVALQTRGMVLGSTKVFTSLGEIQGTISQGGVVTFSLIDAPEWKKFTVPLAQDTNRRLPVYIYLRNSTGFSAPAIIWVYFPKP